MSNASPKLDVPSVQLRPAYGNYTHADHVLQAFLSGKDFRLCPAQGNQLCSIRNFNPGTMIELRYGKYFSSEFCFVLEPIHMTMTREQIQQVIATHYE